MNEKKIGELMNFLMNEGCEESAVVSLSEMKETLGIREDISYLENLIMSFERSGMLKIKYKKGEDFCISLLPKAKLFLNERSERDEIEKEIKITLPAKKIFLLSFLASLLASALVAVLAVVIVKVL